MKKLKRIIAMALTVAMATGLLTVSVSAASFSDVPSNHWASVAIEEMAVNGIINGDGDGTFRPGSPITRAEFAAMINNAFGYTQAGSISFSDVNQSDWYYEHIAKAVSAGYMNGDPDGEQPGQRTISSARKRL